MIFQKESLYWLFLFIFTLFSLAIVVQALRKPQSLNQHAAGTACTSSVTFTSGIYLTTQDRSFFYAGQPICLYGATIYTSQGPGAPSYNWLSTNFPQRIDWDLQMAQQAHINLIRPTDQTNNATDDPYNPTVWANMDYLVQQAQKYHMFVELDLSTFANHLKKQNINPFDPAEESAWQQYIDFVANRYKNTPNIANYSLEGEVNTTNCNCFPTSTTQGYLDFYTRVTNDVFAVDQNHLIAAGGFSHLNDPNSGIPWQQIFSLPHVNLASIHVYPSNPLDPINSSNDLHITMPMVGTWAQQNNKPAEVEEYGFQNQIGDSTRASAMNTILQASLQYGFTGLIIWNLGPEVVSGAHYDVNPNWPLAWQQLVSGSEQFYGVSSGSPSVMPTTTPVPSIQPTDTPSPSITPVPTNTPVPNSTILSFPSILLHGVGNAGDSVSPGSPENLTPMHSSRTISVSLYTGNNQLILTKTGIITYQPATGDFTGNVSLGTGFTSGTYTVKVTVPQYLTTQVPGFYQITAGQSIQLPQLSLVVGDANGDNQLDILDYNELLGCYSDLAPATNCPGNNKAMTDFNDDGAVNQVDYNLFLRELSVRTGQ